MLIYSKVQTVMYLDYKMCSTYITMQQADQARQRSSALSNTLQCKAKAGVRKMARNSARSVPKSLFKDDNCMDLLCDILLRNSHSFEELKHALTRKMTLVNFQNFWRLSLTWRKSRRSLKSLAALKHQRKSQGLGCQFERNHQAE